MDISQTVRGHNETTQGMLNGQNDQLGIQNQGPNQAPQHRGTVRAMLQSAIRRLPVLRFRAVMQRSFRSGMFRASSFASQRQEAQSFIPQQHRTIEGSDRVDANASGQMPPLERAFEELRHQVEQLQEQFNETRHMISQPMLSLEELTIEHGATSGELLHEYLALAAEQLHEWLPTFLEQANITRHELRSLTRQTNRELRTLRREAPQADVQPLEQMRDWCEQHSQLIASQHRTGVQMRWDVRRFERTQNRILSRLEDNYHNIQELNRQLDSLDNMWQELETEKNALAQQQSDEGNIHRQQAILAQQGQVLEKTRLTQSSLHRAQRQQTRWESQLRQNQQQFLPQLSELLPLQAHHTAFFDAILASTAEQNTAQPTRHLTEDNQEEFELESTLSDELELEESGENATETERQQSEAIEELNEESTFEGNREITELTESGNTREVAPSEEAVTRQVNSGGAANLDETPPEGQTQQTENTETAPEMAQRQSKGGGIFGVVWRTLALVFIRTLSAPIYSVAKKHLAPSPRQVVSQQAEQAIQQQAANQEQIDQETNQTTLSDTRAARSYYAAEGIASRVGDAARVIGNKTTDAARITPFWISSTIATGAVKDADNMLEKRNKLLIQKTAQEPTEAQVQAKAQKEALQRSQAAHDIFNAFLEKHHLNLVKGNPHPPIEAEQNEVNINAERTETNSEHSAEENRTETETHTESHTENATQPVQEKKPWLSKDTWKIIREIREQFAIHLLKMLQKNTGDNYKSRVAARKKAAKAEKANQKKIAAMEPAFQALAQSLVAQGLSLQQNGATQLRDTIHRALEQGRETINALQQTPQPATPVRTETQQEATGDTNDTEQAEQNPEQLREALINNLALQICEALAGKVMVVGQHFGTNAPEVNMPIHEHLAAIKVALNSVIPEADTLPDNLKLSANQSANIIMKALDETELTLVALEAENTGDSSNESALKFAQQDADNIVNALKSEYAKSLQPKAPKLRRWYHEVISRLLYSGSKHVSKFFDYCIKHQDEIGLKRPKSLKEARQLLINLSDAYSIWTREYIAEEVNKEDTAYEYDKKDSSPNVFSNDGKHRGGDEGDILVEQVTKIDHGLGDLAPKPPKTKREEQDNSEGFKSATIINVNTWKGRKFQE